jgi:hypothetical protein
MMATRVLPPAQVLAFLHGLYLSPAVRGAASNIKVSKLLRLGGGGGADPGRASNGARLVK